jgi:hypothetical protein
MPVIVVIAKADTLTDDELAAQRAEISARLASARIHRYTFLEQRAGGEGEGGAAKGRPKGGKDGSAPAPSLSKAEAAAEAAMERRLRGPRFSRGRGPCDPLAVLARGATYPWGSVDVENPAHSDFPLLRQLLLSHHTERLIDLARVRYRLYRAGRIRREHLGRLVSSLALVAAIARAAGAPPPTQLARALLLLLAQWRSGGEQKGMTRPRFGTSKVQRKAK